MDSEFNDKIATLVESFENRIHKLRRHIADLETRIGELRTAKDEVNASFDEFLSLHELSAVIQTTQDPARVVKALAELVGKFIEYAGMGIYLFADKAGGLEPLGEAPARLTQAAQSQYDEGIVDWVISERRPIVIPWTESFGQTVDSPHNNLILVPLIVGDQPLGVALLSTVLSADDFSAQELKILFFAVSHAAVAIQNALRTREITTTKDFLSNLLENAGDIIFSIDLNGNFTYLNPGIEELGYQKEELLNQHYRTLFKRFETEKRIHSTLRHGSRQVFDLEVPFVRGHAQQFTINLVPLKDERKRTTGALGIMRNVTEINLLQRKLLESERLAAYTQTVITLNHEINNPLTTVLGNVYLLEKDSKKLDDPRLSQRLKVIQENCLRIQAVIKKLERIDELKTVTYLGSTKMVDLDEGSDDS
jgi:PAS domain S-box-containing protein